MAGPVRETIMVSALQHYAYCPRQCALIHVDMAWEDNLFTMRGHRAHEIIDIPQGMTRAGLRVETALPIWSEELGPDRASRCRRVSSRWNSLSRRTQSRPSEVQEGRRNSALCSSNMP